LRVIRADIPSVRTATVGTDVADRNDLIRLLRTGKRRVLLSDRGIVDGTAGSL
jgi:hypothetical protein